MINPSYLGSRKPVQLIKNTSILLFLMFGIHSAANEFQEVLKRDFYSQGIDREAL